MARIPHVQHRSSIADIEAGNIARVDGEGEGQDLIHARSGARVGYFRDSIAAAPEIPEPQITGAVHIARVIETDLRTITAEKHLNGGRRRISVGPVFVPAPTDCIGSNLVLD